MLVLASIAIRRNFEGPAPAPIRKRAAAQFDEPRPLAESPREGDLAAVASVETEAPWPSFRRKLEELTRRRDEIGARNYRKAVLAATAAFLEFDAATTEAFDATRQVVQTELERIQIDMGRELLRFPVDLSDRQLQRIQFEVGERHLDERRLALARMEAFLGEGENHRRFREFLEVWIMEICRGFSEFQ